MGDTKSLVRAAYLSRSARVKLSRDAPSTAWMAIWDKRHELSDDVHDESLTEISIPVWLLFGLGSTFRHYARVGRLAFEPDSGTATILRNGLASRQERWSGLLQLS